MSRDKKLRILCFGDSLTSGFASHGLISHPYEEKMAEVLQAGLPQFEIETREDGNPGDRTGFFMGRLLDHFEPGNPKFDWTVVLGGTNDLAFNSPPETIFENLQKCWNVALSRGSKVLALTVPEAGIKGKIDQRRDKLNELIREAQGGNLYVHDHHAAVPYWSMSKEDRSLYWDDNVHLTAEGYDLMGQRIAARLLEILQEERAHINQAQESHQESHQGSSKGEAPVSSRLRRKKGFKDDNEVFEEETGDSSRLAEGYVVVRKKDLD